MQFSWSIIRLIRVALYLINGQTRYALNWKCGFKLLWKVDSWRDALLIHTERLEGEIRREKKWENGIKEDRKEEMGRKKDVGENNQADGQISIARIDYVSTNYLIRSQL